MAGKLPVRDLNKESFAASLSAFGAPAEASKSSPADMAAVWHLLLQHI